MTCYIFIRLIYERRLYLIEDRGLTAFRQLLGTEMDHYPLMAELYRARRSSSTSRVLTDGFDQFLIQPIEDGLLRQCDVAEIEEDWFLKTLLAGLRQSDRELTTSFRAIIESDQKLGELFDGR